MEIYWTGLAGLGEKDWRDFYERLALAELLVGHRIKVWVIGEEVRDRAPPTVKLVVQERRRRLMVRRRDADLARALRLGLDGIDWWLGDAGARPHAGVQG